ncbi:hypothetical protein M8818_001800 [Zalaria obscura]|uniref:Uncharacterized protein n=1 Tax=Zalaria obscura TaxID=2024903 RepID=A0ACC3SMK9_9PEZI
MFKLERCDLWQKRYFIPLWLLQLALSVLLLVDFSIIAGVVNQFDGPDAFIIGNLVYGSVIYHRQRMARRAKGEYAAADLDRATTPVQTPGDGGNMKATPNVEAYPLTEHFAPQAPLSSQGHRAASPRLSPEMGKEIGSPNLQSSNGRQPTAAHPVYREPTEYYSPSPAGPSGTHTLPPPHSAQQVAALNARYDELETGPSGTYTLPPPHPAQRVAALNARYDELE